MFENVPLRASAVDACASSLREAILEGKVAAGARLPTERDLAAQFGVNRVTVRSALGRLATAGLVSVRQGSGYVVRDFRRAGGPDLVGALCDLARRRGDLPLIARDLLFVRSCLAHGVLVRLAAAPPKRAAIKAIRAAVDQLERVVEASAPRSEIAAADLEVIAAILDGTESPVLRLFLNPITSLLRDLPELIEVIYAEPRQNVAAFRGIVAWLAQPDAAAIDTIVAALRALDEEAVARLGHAKRPVISRRPRARRRSS